MIDINSSWMNNPDFLAGAAHFFGGFSIVLLAAYFGRNKMAIRFAFLFVVYAAVKEFWYDANYELPIQTSKDNWFDFITYLAGLFIALVAIFEIKPRIKSN